MTLPWGTGQRPQKWPELVTGLGTDLLDGCDDCDGNRPALLPRSSTAYHAGYMNQTIRVGISLTNSKA